MLFQSPEQHSLAQFNKLKELVNNPQTLNRQTIIWLAVQLVQHGWPDADIFIHQIISQLDSQDAKNFLNKKIFFKFHSKTYFHNTFIFKNLASGGIHSGKLHTRIHIICIRSMLATGSRNTEYNAITV